MLFGTYPAFAQKVKKEVILYKEADAVAVGYTYKGQFADSSRITIYSLPSSAKYRKKKRGNEIYFKSKYKEYALSALDVIADGIYYKTNGKAYLEGEYVNSYVTYKGTFSFCNSPDGVSIIANAKSGEKFKFELIDSDYCHVKNTNNWEMFITKVKDKYSIRVNFLRSDNIESLKGSVPLKTVGQSELIYDKAFNLLSKIDNAEVTFKNGDSFAGNLKIDAQSEKWTDRKISWSELSGNYKYATGETFTGEWQPISFTMKGNKPAIFIPTHGTMTFKDRQRIEIWVLNQDKFSLYLATNESKEVFQLYLLSLNFGLPFGAPRMLVFTNGKLSRINE